MLVAALVLSSFGCKDSAAPPTAQSIAATPGLVASAVAGSTLAAAPSVKVVDGSGKGFAGTTITFTVTGGGGRITTLLPTVVTDDDGVAAITSWTLGQDAGPNTLTAAAEGLNGSPVTFTVLGVAGPPVAMNPSAGNAQVGTVGAPVATPPAVKITDINANPVAGVAVTFAAGLGGGSVTGANATTNANGIATVGSWTMGTRPGTNTLTATAPQLQPVLFGVPASAAAATRLAIATQPPLVAFNDVALAPQPVIQVQDVYGNLVTSATLPVTAAIISGVGTLGGTMTVTAVGGVAAFTDLVVSGFSTVGNIAFGFSAPSVAGATSVSVATATSVNVSIDGLYITQSTQTYTRGVPLIAGRAGLVRVFVKASGPNTFAPPVRVRLYQGANLTTPVQTYTINAPSSSVPTGVDEATLTSSWNVTIPANVMTTGLSILADVDPTGIPSEPPVDNVFPVSGVPLSLDVRTTPPYKVTFVPVIQPGVVQGNVTDANVPTYMDFAMRVYPLPGYDAVVHAPFTYGAQLASGYDATWTDLLVQMNAMRSIEAPNRNFYGVIHPAYSSGGTGLGYIGGLAAIGVDWLGGVPPSTNYRSMTAAHEWGHNFGRSHINCGGPADPDPLYPYDPATIGVFGYDIVLSESRASTLADLMSYCSPLWISDYTYRAVLTYRGSVGTGATTSAAPQHGMLVWGRIGPNGVVLEPSFEVDAPPSLPQRGGAYTVRGTDDAGGDVFSISFDGIEIDHLPGERQFAYVVPMAANGRKPAMIRLAANGREAIRRGAPAAVASGVSATAIASLRTLPAAAQRSRLQWDASSYSMALVRDPGTGQVLAFARGGQIDVAAPGQSIDVTLSDGVSSVRKVIAIPPR